MEDNHGPVGQGVKQGVSDVALVHAISVVSNGWIIKRLMADYPSAAGGSPDYGCLPTPLAKKSWTPA
jgi:hypothetical protein